jgi:hypothetical protein
MKNGLKKKQIQQKGQFKIMGLEMDLSINFSLRLK